MSFLFFFFNDTATTEIYTLSLHDALPICADVAHEGAIDPGLAEHARQPGRGELQRQRRIAGLLEAQLGQRVEGHEHQKANEIETFHLSYSRGCEIGRAHV